MNSWWRCSGGVSKCLEKESSIKIVPSFQYISCSFDLHQCPETGAGTCQVLKSPQWWLTSCFSMLLRDPSHHLWTCLRSIVTPWPTSPHLMSREEKHVLHFLFNWSVPFYWAKSGRVWQYIYISWYSMIPEDCRQWNEGPVEHISRYHMATVFVIMCCTMWLM